ncbi:MAG: SDR family oxidoreductase [Proteobacteria bacterium]|nr:SDR family oxidoreductase [Pseudomonadota bacterium]MBI3499493.1 SDR family oxidoreductase [Pseudomonadota bacterium]
MSFARYPSLESRSVFVSGGGSGIGASIVEHFAQQGSKVAFVDVDKKASRALAAGIASKRQPKPLFIPCDLHDIAALRKAIKKAAAAHGPITALVNNAARDDRHRIEDVTPEYWDERIQVNIRHQFFAAQAVAPGMRKAGGGSIINMGSSSWMNFTPELTVYMTAKSGVIGQTRGLARDLGADRIRVNTVVPGWIMTDRQVKLWLTPEAEADLMKAQCLKEKLHPPDIARMVLWLAADDSRLVTGQDFIVNGGR